MGSIPSRFGSPPARNWRAGQPRGFPLTKDREHLSQPRHELKAVIPRDELELRHDDLLVEHHAERTIRVDPLVQRLAADPQQRSGLGETVGTSGLPQQVVP